MFTKCPECQTIQQISAAQLQSGQGMLQCRNCFGIFYALAHISDSAAALDEKNQSDEPLLWDTPHSDGHRKYWQAASVVALLLLAGQITYFKSDSLVQNPNIRVGLEKLCQLLHCQLPVYRNLQEFSILQGQLLPSSDNSISFQTAISNQAPFAQNYPNLKLTLLDYAGNAFAQRIFHPDEYLQKDTPVTLLADANAEINLKIVQPKQQLGGYTFDLID